MSAGASKPFKGNKNATKPTGGKTVPPDGKKPPMKLAGNPSPRGTGNGPAKGHAKFPNAQPGKPTAGHQGATRVQGMELHHTPSGHAQNLLKQALGNNSGTVGKLQGQGSDFASAQIGSTTTRGRKS